MIDKLEDSLNGGYSGLYGEVVSDDCYRLRTLDFVPEVVIDCGANVGIFSRFARELFPKALILAVEPNPENFAILKRFTSDSMEIICINKAIGIGNIWHGTTASNGGGETYISEGLGYPANLMGDGVEKSNIETTMPDLLILQGLKTVFKMDIEGAENAVWSHKPSMDLLKGVDYICAEIHQYALTGALLPAVRQQTFEALASFIPTHRCEWVNTSFWATKRQT